MRATKNIAGSASGMHKDASAVLKAWSAIHGQSPPWCMPSVVSWLSSLIASSNKCSEISRKRWYTRLVLTPLMFACRRRDTTVTIWVSFTIGNFIRTSPDSLLYISCTILMKFTCSIASARSERPCMSGKRKSQKLLRTNSCTPSSRSWTLERMQARASMLYEKPGSCLVQSSLRTRRTRFRTLIPISSTQLEMVLKYFSA
mmetsp:Transcript_6246/g.38808  ORF Transcript_6246/g.38808 Transcript_6246/m.38808 type:complete len:201 (+) Transcript_6246:2974-3576(+)